MEKNKKHKRKGLSKKIRFEVFKRDSFTCQYCGAKSPDVLLHIDHIKPVAKGGKNNILNLITACVDCNLGKSARELSDNSVINKQREQLDKLQEKTDQMELMFKWQQGLLDIKEKLLNKIVSYWEKLNPDCKVNGNGFKVIRKLVKEFNPIDIMEAMNIATETYVKENDKSSIDSALARVGGICVNKKRQDENPEAIKVFYVCGILRRKFDDYNKNISLGIMYKALKLQIKIKDIEDLAIESNYWCDWKYEVEQLIDGVVNNGS